MAERPSALVERLSTILAQRDDKQVFIKGDRNITYGQFIEVVGLLNQGGIQHLGLVAEEITPRSGETQMARLPLPRKIARGSAVTEVTTWMIQ